jgi:Bacterial aa3 type cytochrome c oxidase subunit IV
MLAPAGSERDLRMASHGTTEYSTADGNDYAEHERTYRMFLSLVKWNVIVIAIILLLMAYFLT